MNTTPNFPLDLLTPGQAAYIQQTLNRREAERTAAAMLERFAGCASADPHLVALWLDACHDETHPDYLCDVLADRFSACRNDRTPDICVWEQVVSDVLAETEAQYAEADAFGIWMKRPLDALIRQCWRNRMEDFSVTFTLDANFSPQLSSLFTLTCSHQADGQLRIRLQDACSQCASDMYYCPDENGLPQCDLSQLEEDIREYVQVYFQLKEQPMPSWLWIRSY